jgi:hypothetical protein
LRGVGTELNGGLIGGRSEVGEEVADFVLAGIDDLAGGRLVDGGGHSVTQVLETPTQLFQKGVGREGRFGRHRLLLVGRQTGKAPSLLSRAFLSA